jgi:hypothetical protein
VVPVVRHAEVGPDDLGDAPGGPQVRAVSAPKSSRSQDAHQALPLAAGELGGSPRGGTDLEPLLAFAAHAVAPTHHGARSASQLPCDGVQRESGVEERECAATAVFEDFRGTLGSHDRGPPSEDPEYIALFMQMSIYP